MIGKKYYINPETLRYFLGAYNTPNSNQNFDIKILGYFSDRGEEKYMPLETPISQSYTTESTASVQKMHISGISDELVPKGYLVKVSTRGIGAGEFTFQFNGETELGIGSGEYNDGRFKSKNLEEYIYVNSDRGNPYEISLTYTMKDREQCSEGIYDVTIIGYFY